MAFFVDNFTEATTDTELPSHTPDTGTGWTRTFQDGSGPVFNAEFTPDTCGGTTANNSACVYTADATYPTANYEVQWTHVTAAGFSTRPYYVLARYQDTSNTYAVRIFGGGTTNAQIYKKVTGTWTAIGTAVSIADGSVCKFSVNGTTLKLYDDTVEVDSVTDSSISAAGKAGLGHGGGGWGTASTDDCNSVTELDAFSVTDLGGGASTWPHNPMGHPIRGALGGPIG